MHCATVSHTSTQQRPKDQPLPHLVWQCEVHRLVHTVSDGCVEVLRAVRCQHQHEIARCFTRSVQQGVQRVALQRETYYMTFSRLIWQQGCAQRMLNTSRQEASANGSMRVFGNTTIHIDSDLKEVSKHTWFSLMFERDRLPRNASASSMNSNRPRRVDSDQSNSLWSCVTASGPRGPTSPPVMICIQPRNNTSRSVYKSRRASMRLPNAQGIFRCWHRVYPMCLSVQH